MLDRSVSHASEVEQYNASLVFEGIVACSKAALAAGVPVALGNDVGCPWITQYDFWRELVYFCKFIGVSEAFALHSATLVNAQVAGIGELTGSLEVGKHADMIVTTKNPLEDLSTLRAVKHVVRDGVFIARPHVKRKVVVNRELDKLQQAARSNASFGTADGIKVLTEVNKYAIQKISCCLSYSNEIA